MPKWKESFTAGRKYRPEWEKMYPWIEKCKSDNDKTFCNICKKELQPRKATIQEHSTSKDHLYKSKPFGSNNKIVFVPQTAELSNQTEQAMQLAVATCCHNSIASIDHFGEITKNLKREAVGKYQVASHKVLTANKIFCGIFFEKWHCKSD